MSINYKKDNQIYAGYTLYFYDANKTVVGIIDDSRFMTGIEKSRRTVTTEYDMPDGATSYKLVNKRAYMKYMK
ncbi:MAG: hypothetical protein NC124_19250 [Clostridium sp.]|nr:hypothetical protein [Clostridium sp.]